MPLKLDSLTRSDKVAIGLIAIGALISGIGGLHDFLSSFPIVLLLASPWLIWRLAKANIKPRYSVIGIMVGLFGMMAINTPSTLVPAQTTVAKPVIPAAPAHAFTEDDFIFDKVSLPVKYKDIVVAGVNKIRADDARCQEHISPASTSLAASKSKPGKPVFYVTCGAGAQNLVNVYFTPEDVKEGKTFSAPKHFPDAAGNGALTCERYVKHQVNFPETVDFDWGSPVNQLADGRTIITKKFTAQNAFGVPSRYVARCTFSEVEMTHGDIQEVIE